VILKKDGSLCSVINLKPSTPSWPTNTSRWNLQGEGAAKRRGMDKGCLPLSSHCKTKFLRFIRQDTTYGFTPLPFGLCSAPCILTKLLHPVMAYICFMGLRLVIYLDDFLLMAEDQETLQKQVQQTINLLKKHCEQVERSLPSHYLHESPGGLNLDDTEEVTDSQIFHFGGYRTGARLLARIIHWLKLVRRYFCR